MPAPLPSSQEHRDALERSLRWFKLADEMRRPRETKWREIYKLYRSYAEPRNDGRANVFIPESFTLIETVVPRVIDALFGSFPYVSLLPVGPEDVGPASKHESLVNFQLDERLRVVEKFVSFVKEALTYGTAVGMVPWRIERRLIKGWGAGVKLLLGIIPVPTRVPKQAYETTYDDPDFVHPDLLDFWIDPFAEDIEHARFVIVRTWLDFDYLKRKEAEGLYGNIDELKNGGSRDSGERGATLHLSDVGMAGGQPEDSRDKPIEVLSIWENDRLTVVADQRVVISEGENPFWDGRKPLLSVVDHKVPHEFYGIGELEPNLGLQYELNTMRNQRLNFLNVALDLMWLLNRNADIDEAELVSRPNGVIHVDSFEDLKQLEVNKDLAPAFAEERSIRESIQSTSGVFDYSRGATPNRGETATTVVSLQQAAEMRFKLKTRLFEYSGLRDLVRFMVARNLQFMDRARAVRILGPDGVQFLDLRPEDIGGNFDYRPAGSSVEPLANRQIAQQNWRDLYDRFKDDPDIDRIKLKRKVFETMGVKDADGFFVQRNPIEALMAAMGGKGGVAPGQPATARPTPIGPPVGGVNQTPGVVYPPNTHQPKAQ